MTDKKETPINIIATLDQAQSVLRDTAPIFAGYYKSLIDENVPDDLARELTKELHEIYWATIFPTAFE